MANQTLNTLLMFRAGLSSAWQASNIILNEGEPGYETDTHILKIGDGVTAYNDLPAVSGDDSLAEQLQAHISNYNNPHQVTKAQIGLGNVDNIADASQVKHGTQSLSAQDLNTIVTPGWYYSGASNTCLNKPSGITAFSLSVLRSSDGYYCQILIGASASNSRLYIRTCSDTSASTWTDWLKFSTSTELNTVSNTLTNHVSNTSNPHQVTKTQIGLSNVDNTSDEDKPVSSAQAAAISDAKSAGTTAQSTINNHIADLNNPHQVTKTQVGLGNVNNTADADKPISTATQTALNNKLSTSGNQTLSGSLTITGDLTVQGTTVTQDAETLSVKDNLIVTNSDKITLANLSGLAINISSVATYGIVYDPSDQTVKLGEGTINSGGEFTFNSSEGLAIAVRDDSSLMTDGDLIAWDGTSNKLVDSGKSISDFVDLSSAQTITGNKTLTGYFKVIGTAADRHLTTRGIGGCDTSGANPDDLYINYGTSYGVRFGSTGQGMLKSDGSVQCSNITASGSISEGGTALSSKYVPATRTINSKALSSNITLSASDVGAEPSFTKNTAFNKNFGTASGTVCEGNDSRVTSAVQNATFAGTSFTKSGTTLSITQSDARSALGLGSIAYKGSGDYLPITGGTLTGSVTINNQTAYTSGTEQVSLKARFRTGANQYGAVYFGKEGPNSGSMIRLDQVEGTPRLYFRASATAGAIVWNQPETNSQLYFDVNTVNFRSAGYVASSDSFRPSVTGKKDLGTSSLKFNNLYVNNIPGYVPTTTTVAGKSLSSNVTLGTLTIQLNGSSVGTYNGSANSTINLSNVYTTSNKPTASDLGIATIVSATITEV